MAVLLYILIFGGATVFIVGMFLWADYKVKKRNKEEYERTGIMPEYSNTDATAYLLEKFSKFESDTFKIRYILSGVLTTIVGIMGLNVCRGWFKGSGTGNMVIILIFGIPLLGMVFYGIYQIIKGIRMK